MVKEAKIKVKLDVSKAKSDLEELGKHGEETAGRINRGGKGRRGAGSGGSRGSRGGSGGAGPFKVGALAGMGFAMGKRVGGYVGVTSSVNEVISQSFSGLASDWDAFVGAPIARAQKGAREETVAATDLLTYHTGDTSHAKQYYNQVLQVKHLPHQVGAQKVRSAIAGGRGEDVEGLGPLDKALNTIVDSIESGFENIKKMLGG